MSEFGFRARDSGLPNFHVTWVDKTTLKLGKQSAGPLLMTQTQRAAAYRDYIRSLVGLPFVIGYHMFMWADEPSGGQLFGAASNFGLVHLSDDPYEVLTDAFTSINAEASAWHMAGPVPSKPAQPQLCEQIAGFVCNQGLYCKGPSVPTPWAHNGAEPLDQCVAKAKALNATCFMHKSVAGSSPGHPACRILTQRVSGLNHSEFGYSSWVASDATRAAAASLKADDANP